MLTATAPYKENQGAVVEAPDHELWMRSHDDVQRTATDIIEYADENDGWIDIACIGAACVNQANKAIAVARERVMRRGKDYVCQQWFSTIEDDQGRRRTRLMLRVFEIKRQW